MPHWLKLALAGAAGLLIGGLLAWIAVPAKIVQRQAPAEERGHHARIDDAKRSRPGRIDEPASRPHSNADETPALLIRGIARLKDGTPCAGLPLALEKEAPNFMEGIDLSRLPPTQRNAYLQEQLDWQREHLRLAETGDDGRFSFRVGPGRQVLQSRDRTRPLTESEIACQAGDNLEVEVNRVTLIRVEFLLESSQPVVQQVAYRFNEGYSAMYARGGVAREHAVDPGPLRITANAGLLLNGEVTVEVPPEGLEEPIRVVLKGQPGLTIKPVVTPPYYPRVTLRIIATDEIKQGWPPRPWDAIVGVDSNRYVSYTRGGFYAWTVTDLQPGRYTVFAVSGAVDILTREEFEYHGGMQEEELRLPDPLPHEHVTLRIYDPDNKPLNGATVAFFMENGNNSWADPVIAKGNGEYWLKLVPPENYFSGERRPTGERLIDVRHDLHGRRILRVPVDVSGDLELRFKAKVKLVVHLDNLPDERGDFVMAAFPSGASEHNELNPRGPGQRRAPPIVQPRTEYELSPGPVTFVLRLRSNNALIEQRELELGEEGADIRISIPDFHSLRVIVPPDFGTGVLVLDGISGRQTARPGDGRAEFSDIMAGDYTLRSGTGVMKIRVPHEGELHFQPQPFNALRVGGTGINDALSQAGLQRQDIIREINGLALSGTYTEMLGIFRASTNEGDASLRIQRNGQWHTLTMTAEQLAQAKSYWLEATRIG